MKNETTNLTLKQQASRKRAEIRNIVRFMNNKASYERLNALNKKLTTALKELNKIESSMHV